MIRSYSELLKRFIDFTDTKLIVLANALRYDTSYISKWCSGTKLPTAKAIHEINDTLGAIFAEAIIEEDALPFFYHTFHIDRRGLQDLTEDQLAKKITQILNDAYYEAAPEPFVEVGGNELAFHAGTYKVKKQIAKILKDLIILGDAEPLYIWTNFDVFSPQMKFILDIIKEYQLNDRQITVAAGYTFDETANSLQLYRLMSAYSNLSIELYDTSPLSGFKFIVIEDKFFSNFTIDNEGNFETVTYSFDLDLVQEFSDFITAKVPNPDYALKTIDSEEVASSNFRTNFYTGSQFKFLNGYGFEFLLPPEVVSDIVESNQNGDGTSAEIQEIKKLEVIWEELFINAEIDFFMPRSSLFEYMEHGYIMHCGIHYRLRPEQRSRHYAHIIECMRNNPKIQFYLIDDFATRNLKNYKEFNFHYNGTQCFLKNSKLAKTAEISVVTDPRLMDLFESLLGELEANNAYIAYDADSLESLLTKYEKIFNPSRD